MVTVKFIGRIDPAGIRFFIKSKTKVKATDRSPGSKMNWTYTVDAEASAVTVNVEMEEWNKERDLMLAYTLALDVGGAFVDLASFMTGLALHLVFDSIIEPDGTNGPIIPMRDALVKVGGPSPANLDPMLYDKILPLLVRNRSAMYALRDFVDGYTHIHMTTISCGRAVEGLRHAIAPNQDRTTGWAKLRETLRVDQTYLKFITDESIAPRHANFDAADGDANTEVSNRTWMIMDRYLSFLLRGGVDPLPISDFPLLLG
jgi:hypothetical protein